MRTEFILDKAAGAEAGGFKECINLAQDAEDRAAAGNHHFAWLVSASAEEAERLVPWAAIIEPVEGGWMAYESWDDYETAQRQK
jgi:hypothetical protein